MKKIKEMTDAQEKRIDDFNDFGCSYMFYSVETKKNDQPFFIRVDWQITINPKCQATLKDLQKEWIQRCKQ